MAYKYATPAPGIRTREHPTRKHGVRRDTYFMLRYTVDGKQRSEGLGWATQGWTLAKAQAELFKLKEAARTGEGPATLAEKREQARRAREAEQNKPTVRKLWDFFQQAHAGRPNSPTDASNAKHLAHLMDTLVEDLRTADADALRRSLEAQGKSAQTVKHVMGLLKRIISYGAKRGLCTMPDISRLHFDMPKVDNIRTECLTPEQVQILFQVLDDDEDQNLAALTKLALLTGMRRGALFNLEWRDLDWRERLITLRGAAAKSGKTAVIPLSEYARMVLLGVQRTESPLVFPGKDGGPRVNISRFAKRIHKRAHLPEGFRLLHGLRHTYASWLASSGEVDLYLLQKMLTHGSPQMTQRYADIADRAKRRASKVMDECVHQAVNAEPVPEPTGAKVVPFGGKRR